MAHKRDPKTGAATSFTEERRNGKILYRGWIRRGGMQWRVSAGTKAECEAKVKGKLVELEREGVASADLSIEERRDAAKARKLLGEKETLESALKELQVVRETLGSGRRLLDMLDEVREVRALLDGRATPREAAEFWAARHPADQGVPLGDAVRAYLKAKAKKSSSHRRTLGQRLEALVGKLGGKIPLASLGKEEVECVLEDWAATHSPFSDASWNAWLTTFTGFFNWATKAYELPTNPVEGLEKREVEPGEVDFMPVEDVEKLLRATEKVAPDYAPAVAILFFAGLRPTELTGQYDLDDGKGIVGGLTWDCVDIDGEIFLAGRDTKNRRKRQVPISDNLRAWLDAYGGEKRGRLVPNPTAWRRVRNEIVKEAGVAWPQDFARHTYASMHSAFYKNRAALEYAMGHDPASRVLEANYRKPVRQSEAERFWAIVPGVNGGER